MTAPPHPPHRSPTSDGAAIGRSAMRKATCILSRSSPSATARLHGPRQHQLRRAPDEPRPALQRHRLRLRRRPLLPQLRRLRSPLQPPALPLRSPPLARPHHGHLGPPRHGHALRPDAARSSTSPASSSAWRRPASSPESSSTSCSGSRRSCAPAPSAASTSPCRSAPSSWALSPARCSTSMDTSAFAGWQWLFLVEGLPPFCSASPSSSVFPTSPPTPPGSPNERHWIIRHVSKASTEATHHRRLHRPHPPRPARLAARHLHVLHACLHLRLHLLAPDIVQASTGLSITNVGFIIAGINLLGAPAMLLNAMLSDRTRASATGTSSPAACSCRSASSAAASPPSPHRASRLSVCHHHRLQRDAGPALVIARELLQWPLRRRRHRRHQHHRHPRRLYRPLLHGPRQRPYRQLPARTPHHEHPHAPRTPPSCSTSAATHAASHSPPQPSIDPMPVNPSSTM